MADDLPLMTWLNDHIWPAEQQWVSAEFVRDGSHLAVAEMIRSGTTCFNDMYFFADQTAEVAIEAGLRAMLGLIIIDFPSAWARDTQEYLDKGEQIHDKYKHNSLINTAFAPHAPYTLSDVSLEKIAMLAEELDLQIHMHVHETADEIEQSLEQHGQRPISRLSELGLLSPRLMAVHMTQLNEEEIDLTKKYGVHVLHCPESNMKLASGCCPVHKILGNGINVALGTDGAASNNDLDMIGEMRSAALLGKTVAQDPQALDAHTVLAMATLNGARAMGLESKIGSLEKGKEADITAIDLGQLETQPVYDPVAQIVYAANRNQVSDVWVAGRQLLKDGEHQSLNSYEIIERSNHWKNKIISESNS
jgi:5-methylthioadenosine/S-adenosylhomocysteine deaminase